MIQLQHERLHPLPLLPLLLPGMNFQSLDLLSRRKSAFTRSSLFSFFFSQTSDFWRQASRKTNLQINLLGKRLRLFSYEFCHTIACLRKSWISWQGKSNPTRRKGFLFPYWIKGICLTMLNIFNSKWLTLTFFYIRITLCIRTVLISLLDGLNPGSSGW